MRSMTSVCNLEKQPLYLFNFFWKEKIFRKILACGFSKSATLTIFGLFKKAKIRVIQLNYH